MKVEQLKKKLGVSQRKHVALLLGVNKLTLQRWRNQYGDEVSEKYLDKAKSLLKLSKVKIDEELEKAKKRKPDQRFNTRKKVERKKVVADKPEAPLIENSEVTVEDLILDLYYALKTLNPKNGLAEVREALGKYVKNQIKLGE